ncbi:MULTISPECIES: hypothetical protein [Nitrosomonas]|uniref:hypothetical protein n=1 Tax=Nitrosomonas TaxID=914 RepID=UPI00130D90F1|nr:MULTISPECIES: hypothetical protein [Nitrosomonas]UVS59998.1 hypothetical protein NX761_10630 [Nitrosomonas sp. PLL12]
MTNKESISSPKKHLGLSSGTRPTASLNEVEAKCSRVGDTDEKGLPGPTRNAAG